MQACGKGSQLLRRNFLRPFQGLFCLVCPEDTAQVAVLRPERQHQITCFSHTGPRHTPFPPSKAEDVDVHGHLLPS